MPSTPLRNCYGSYADPKSPHVHAGRVHVAASAVQVPGLQPGHLLAVSSPVTQSLHYGARMSGKGASMQAEISSLGVVQNMSVS